MQRIVDIAGLKNIFILQVLETMMEAGILLRKIKAARRLRSRSILCKTILFAGRC